MKDNHKLNVAILTCRQSAQRMNYYNALGRLCKLTVIAERKTPDTVVEEYNIRTENYKVVYLNGIPMFGYMAFCPGVIKKLKEDLYDIIIVEQYATPTAILAISYMHRYKIPFIISADSGFPNRKENKLKYSFKKSIISKADFWITGGKGGAQYLEYYGADSDKTRIFKFSPYSYNDQPQHIPTYEEKKEKKIKLKMKESIVIISVGQQIHRKGFDILLRAVNDIGDDIGIYILGGAPNDECQEI